MKWVLSIVLLCALLTGCAIIRPEDHMLDGDGMERPEPEPIPTDAQIKAMRPGLILDGCEPGAADGRTVRITDYHDGKLTAELSNTGGEDWKYYGVFTLSVRDGEQWKLIPWPEDKVWEDSEFDLADGNSAQIFFDLTELGPLNSGEYLLKTNDIETVFRLVWTE